MGDDITKANRLQNRIPMKYHSSSQQINDILRALSIENDKLASEDKFSLLMNIKYKITKGHHLKLYSLRLYKVDWITNKHQKISVKDLFSKLGNLTNTEKDVNLAIKGFDKWSMRVL